MAYRKLELTDKVRITDGSDDHGQEGEVMAVTHAGTQAQVKFFSRTFSQTSRKWFSQKNLAILASTPIKEKQMTPAQKLGYKVGDKFVMNAECTFKKGSIITLYEDDGSANPLFSSDRAATMFNCAGGQPGAFTSLSKITPYVKPKSQFKVGDRVKVIDAGDGFEYSALGKHGIIRRTDSTSLPVLVDFDDGEDDWGTFEELAHEADVPSVIDIDAINAKLAKIDALSAEIKELLA